MKTLSAAVIPALASTVLLLAAGLSAATPAYALGGCGPNRHRNFYGVCVFGGQREDYCLRRTGHLATRMPNGNLRCF